MACLGIERDPTCLRVPTVIRLTREGLLRSWLGRIRSTCPSDITPSLFTTVDEPLNNIRSAARHPTERFRPHMSHNSPDAVRSLQASLPFPMKESKRSNTLEPTSQRYPDIG